MRKVFRSKKGSAETDLLWVVGLLILLFVLWVATGGPSHREAATGPFLEPPPPLSTGATYGPSGSGDSGRQPTQSSPSQLQSYTNQSNGSKSPYADTVRLQHGNERYTNRPGEEYLVIAADYGDQPPVNITGWRLMNGKNRRGGVSDVVVIPFGVKTFVGGGPNSPRDPIVLTPGGRAIITTGKFNRTSPFPITTSFLVNACSGYLEDIKNYNFTPSLYSRCPSPREEYGTLFLDNKCYEFVRDLQSCHAPVFEERRVGDDRVDYVDNQEDDLSRACKLYLADHFNYDRCLAWHGADPEFYTDEWRVFLNWPYELWSENREVISLYDQSGKLVDELTY